jgi:hypothetical protein
MPEDRKVLHEFKRNADDTLRISLSNYKGRTYVDIRIFYQDSKGELAPDEFRTGMVAAEDALQEKNLWHPADRPDPER